MIIYLICFAIVIVLAYLNESKNKTRRFLTAAGIILIPAILAGMRDFSIGTDVENYILPYFNKASYFSSVFSFLNSYSNNIEEGFLLLTYIVSRVTSNPSWLLFAISFFVNLFIYLALDNVRETNSVLIGETIYLFLFYNETLNLMRQSMACALILYGFSFLIKNNNYKRYFVVQFIAYFFHRTSFLAIPLPILFYLFSYKKIARNQYFVNPNKKTRFKFWMRLFGIIFLTILVVVFFSELMNFAINMGLISEHFQSYRGGEFSGIGTGKLMLLYSATVIIPFLYRNENEYGYIYLAVFLCDIVLFPLQGYLGWLNRVSRYFMYIRIFSLSYRNVHVKGYFKAGKIKKKDVLLFAGILVCIFYWVWIIVIHNNNETIPYIFR